MTLPLESLKLKASAVDHPSEMTDAVSSLSDSLLILTVIALTFTVLFALLAFMPTLQKRNVPPSNKRPWVVLGAILPLIALVIPLVVIIPNANAQEFKSNLSIKHIAMNSDHAKVTFKNDDTLYTATLPKDQIDALSGCKSLIAERTSSENKDSIELGAFKLIVKDKVCTLRGEKQ